MLESLAEVCQGLGIDWNKLIAQMISFGILLYVLWRFAYKPVLDILEKRRDKVEESLKNAEKIKHEVERIEEQRITRKRNSRDRRHDTRSRVRVVASKPQSDNQGQVTVEDSRER